MREVSLFRLEDQVLNLALELFKHHAHWVFIFGVLTP
jgi:hypothetical protein